jgi:hypothetical protein
MKSFVCAAGNFSGIDLTRIGASPTASLSWSCKTGGSRRLLRPTGILSKRDLSVCLKKDEGGRMNDESRTVPVNFFNFFSNFLLRGLDRCFSGWYIYLS